MSSTNFVLALIASAGTAMAQPGTFTELGPRLTPQSFTQDVDTGGGAGVHWFRIELPAVGAADGYVDITNNNAVVGEDITDSMFGFYDNAGALIAFNDDGGPGFWSQLSFGLTAPTRTGETIAGQFAGLPLAGQNGTLSGGVYWIGVCHYFATFAADWTIASTYTGTQNGTLLRITVQPPGAPIPPSGTGLAAPSPVTAGQSVLFTVTVTPGANPASTGLAVSGDLSSIGGSATQTFFDNGTNGDATAGDNIFSYSYAVSVAAGDSTYSLPYSITDAQARTGAGNINGAIQALPDWDETVNGGGDAGQELATAQSPTGTGSLDVMLGSIEAAGDADIYRINICDTANFTATTAIGTAGDTQLFLFSVEGVGVTFSDDAAGLLSTITGQFVTAAGDYYLAISRYDNDPQDESAQALWIDTPFGVERAPDGPGAASVLSTWTGGGGSGAYRISLTGACFSTGGGNVCGAADLGSVGGVAGADNHLDNNDFVVFIDFFFNHNPLADQGSTGGAPGADGAWDNNDFVVFIDNFFTAPASCR